jgi:hypothetical protein
MAPPSESRTTPLTTPAVCALVVAGMSPATSTAANMNTLRNIESPLAGPADRRPEWPHEIARLSSVLKVNQVSRSTGA